MISQKFIFRILEFESYNLKEHYEIPLNMQKELIVLNVLDMATRAQGLSLSNFCNLVSVFNFMNRDHVTVIR